MSYAFPRLSFVVLLACAFFGGCADNSFLELTLELPGRAAMRQNAVVRVLPGDETEIDFSLPWRGLEKNFVLLPNSQEQSVSVESLRDEVDLGLRIEFCATEFCEGLAEGTPSEAWFVIRRPFSIGTRTRLRIEIPNLPNGLPEGPLVIDCSGESCVEGGVLEAGVPDAAVPDASMPEAGAREDASASEEASAREDASASEDASANGGGPGSSNSTISDAASD